MLITGHKFLHKCPILMQNGEPCGEPHAASECFAKREARFLPDELKPADVLSVKKTENKTAFITQVWYNKKFYKTSQKSTSATQYFMMMILQFELQLFLASLAQGERLEAPSP